MKHKFEQHCTDETLELYTMGQLDEANMETLEEHILICEGCQVRLDESDRYVHAMKAAAANLQRAPQTRHVPVLDRVKSWFALPAPALAAAAMALCAIVFVSTLQLQNHGAGALGGGAPVAIALVAERGASISAPANRILDLKLDVRGLSLGSNVRIELVNAEGAQIQTADTAASGESLKLRLSKPLASGAYFVRVYPAGSTDLSREFALDVQ